MITKEQSRARWRELRNLVNDWDPVHLISEGAPEDEYECVVGPLIRLFEQSSPSGNIASFLECEFEEHFGVPGVDATAFAETASAWYRARWLELGCATVAD